MNTRQTIEWISCLLLLLFILSCKKKKKVMDVHPELAGTWSHHEKPGSTHWIEIDKDGTGSMEWYENNTFKRDTKTRKWFMEDAYLIFGRGSKKSDEAFHIDQYPDTAAVTFINGYDTVNAGQRYMRLEDRIYAN
jgi:hypothetical protein